MEQYSQEAAAARLAALNAIRARVAAACGGWLQPDECVQLALVASTRAHAQLLDFMFSSAVAKTATVQAKALAITPAEFDALFGWQSRPVRTAALDLVVREEAFSRCAARLEAAMRTTVTESDQRDIWARSWSRSVCVLGAHFDDHEEALSTALGNLVRGDLRRLEDVRQDLDDEGIDVMLVSSIVAALASSVM